MWTFSLNLDSLIALPTKGQLKVQGSLVNIWPHSYLYIMYEGVWAFQYVHGSFKRTVNVWLKQKQHVWETGDLWKWSC